MIDFPWQRFTRRCAALDRELQAGEEYYSVLVAKGADVIRQDYCAEGWEGPPEASLGWWKAKMPDDTGQKAHWAPNEVLLNYFEQLEQRPDKQDMQYVLALLLVRRRLLVLESTATNDAGEEEFLLSCPTLDREFHVAVQEPTRQQVEQIEAELSQLLFTDAP
ncbi:hypothetical protein [Lignipirellula cremea]|uniref:Uncharacterized protein n=1 Tax=Lignipirellula cremea TaxID=2528010 RepID=A0A518DV96_9BACT|nr:hypothetical protein [Lignipirellula cremea]QDU95759.1 hypothetical protein Pla8534_35760 [Lignipirellula cremea]